MKALMVFVLQLLFSVSVWAGELSYSIFAANGQFTLKSTGGKNSYSEVGLRLGYHFNNTFGVSTSGLVRFVDGGEKSYGAQVAAPITLTTGKEFGFRAYMAPGYRVVRSDHAPLIEGGVAFRMHSAIQLGVGLRMVFHEAFQDKYENEAQFIVNLNGSLF